MTKDILCTLGPSSMNKRTIVRLEELGVTHFRINLSHTKIEELRDKISFILETTSVPLCLDSEGAQVRTGDFKDLDFVVNENSTIRVYKEKIDGSLNGFNFYPLTIFDEINIGDIISIDFNSVIANVISKSENVLTLRILNGGKMGRNKAVTIQREVTLPALTDKDIAAFEIGKEMGIKHYALSFANRALDVFEVRKLVGDESHIISKIECLNGLKNLKEIISASDAILIDRGDLSREEPIEKVPFLQKQIISKAKQLSKKVYVATNLLESMVTQPSPTRAEVNDIYNTLCDGADGLVLAAETAIGAYPIQCTSYVSKLIKVFDAGKNHKSNELDISSVSSLVFPHGGVLVQRTNFNPETDLKSLQKLCVSDNDLMDCEQIALGTYSPLEGFMTADELISVLKDYKLPNQVVWTLPILLQISKSDALKFSEGEKIALTDATGQVRSLLDIEEIYTYDLNTLAREWFGTDSLSHPGVSRLKKSGEFFLGGKITLVKKRQSEFSAYELTPVQTRFLFEKKGWQKIVGFHSRNVIHKVHEFIQMEALDKVYADGLFISPVIGPKKEGDFLTSPILESYQLMLDKGFYPQGKVVLGSFSTYSRYSGPREAVFTALCRKNMGCSHFIIGRDHTGVGDFYKATDNQEIFKHLGNIGIEPIFFDEIGYDEKSQSYKKSAEVKSLKNISGTYIREKLTKCEELPAWFMREEIQQMLIQHIKEKRPIFVGQKL